MNFIIKVRAPFLLLVPLVLSGCMIFRVSQQTHEEEVRQLGLNGLTVKVALQKATTSGFSCSNPVHSRRSGERPTIWATCYKSTPELWCPQRRELSITADEQTDTVSAVETRINNHSCM